MTRVDPNLTAQELMQQARGTSETYMGGALRAIDETIGEDFLKKHPEAAAHIISGFMISAAIDFGTAILSQTLDRLDIGGNIESVHDVIHEGIYDLCAAIKGKED
jgi:hypothetical protein